MKTKVLIGLEIHVELLTKSKMYCGCKNAFGDPPNTNICEICLGYPGALPNINEQAIAYAIEAGTSLNCNIRSDFHMDRKKYFYPDLPKGYQITQESQPICYDGYIDLIEDEDKKRIRIERVHMEEDTGKSIHNEAGDTLMDYNRSGVPLIEIVTHPDLNKTEEVREFLNILRSRLEYLGVSDVKMEEGSLRCDVNINIIDEESDFKTEITEIKNLNSFRAIGRALDSEILRHKEMVENGERGEKETRRWDDAELKTIVMRGEADQDDYRFTPEGDIPFISLEEFWIKEIQDNLPEMPHVKKARFMKDYSLNDYDAENLTSDRDFADLFDELMKYTKNGERAANWFLGDLSRQINDAELKYDEIPFSMKDLADLISLHEKETIHLNAAKKVLRIMFETGDKAEEIVEREAMAQITDTDELEKIVDQVLDDNPQSIEDIKKGRDRALGYLVGQCMKASRGKGNPQSMKKMLQEKLGER